MSGDKKYMGLFSKKEEPSREKSTSKLNIPLPAVLGGKQPDADDALDGLCGSLTRTQRLYGFAICFCVGCALSVMVRAHDYVLPGV